MVSMEVEDDPVDTVQCTRESQETDINPIQGFKMWRINQIERQLLVLSNFFNYMVFVFMFSRLKSICISLVVKDG